MTQYLYGIHDAGGEHLMADKPGTVIITEAIGCDPNDHSGRDYRDLANRGFRVIVRLNNAYYPDGTIPVPERYADFAQRCANFIAASLGCGIWIIGNETNAIIERPHDKPITPAMYADCYNRCYAAIKVAVPTAQVITAAVAPWDASTTYPGNDNGDWVIYSHDVLTAIPHCDGIAIHIYSHGASPALIVSEATMDPPFQHRRYEFRAYLDFLAVVPTDKRDLPVYATESDQVDDWVDANTGWVQAAYSEIDQHNNTPGTQKIVCLALFRWKVYDGEKWGIANKQGVQADFRAAVAKGYGSPDALTDMGAQMKTFIPAIHSDGATSLPDPTLPPREIDPRAEARGTLIQPVNVAPGQQYWRVSRLYTPNEEESDALGPDRHILANVLVDGQRQVGTPLLVTWGGGGAGERATTHTKNNPGYAFSADQLLTPGNFTLEVADGKPSEKVTGIHMGEQTPQGFNPGIHESTLVDFELVTMPGAQPSQPSQPDKITVPPLVHPIADPAKRIISQPFGAKDEDYSRFNLAGHNGIDFAVPEGTQVVAVDDGDVVEAEFDADGYGTYVKIRHAWGESLYAHLNNRVAQPRTIHKGELIGLSGNTGNSTGPHLHFGMRVNPYVRGYPYDGYIDPAPYLINSKPNQPPQPSGGTDIVSLCKQAAQEFGIPWTLLASQAWAESSFDPDAVSSTGADGLMQIMPATWAEWAPKIGAGNDPFDPYQNLRVGAAYLKWLLSQTGGNAYHALEAYGFGIGNTQSGAPVPSAWVEYANKIVHGKDLLDAVNGHEFAKVSK